jgi:hypothetical protein
MPGKRGLADRVLRIKHKDPIGGEHPTEEPIAEAVQPPQKTEQLIGDQ